MTREERAILQAAIGDVLAASDMITARGVFDRLVELGVVDDTSAAVAQVRNQINTNPDFAGKISKLVVNVDGLTVDDIFEAARKLPKPLTVTDIVNQLARDGKINGPSGHDDPVYNRVSTRIYQMKKRGKMPLKWFRDGRTSSEREELKNQIPSIIEELQPINIRGVYYQLVSRGFGPKDDAFLSRVSRLLVEMREEDLIPWHWISETGRTIDQIEDFNSLKDGLETFQDYWYVRNPWIGLEDRVQIWIEKRGLAGVIQDVTRSYHVPLLASGGFSSLTLVNKAAELIDDHDGHTYCYYFGDFDPSGMKIDPAIERRLGERADPDKFTFQRIALNEKQIRQYDLPTRPARKKDNDKNPHLASFEAEHGDDAVELDALPPQVLRQMVEEVITQHINQRHLNEVKKMETADKKKLKRFMASLAQTPIAVI